MGGDAQHRELIPAQVPINVHHLFTHTSGFTYGDNEEPLDEFYETAGLEKAGSLADLLRSLATLPLKREPGTMYEYGFSTDILARLVEVVSGQPFDLLFSDIVMPNGMSGVELARELRRRSEDVKILLTSGHAVDVLERHQAAGEFPIIDKPFRLAELVRRLQTILQDA